MPERGVPAALRSEQLAKCQLETALRWRQYNGRSAIERLPANRIVGDMNPWLLLAEIGVGWFLGSWIAWRIVNGYWRFWE